MAYDPHGQDHRRGHELSGGQAGRGPSYNQQSPSYDKGDDMPSPGFQPPKLGATFYPGGHDDFLMPELISPSPQRIMPEVPSNMQEGLAHLELEANDVGHYRSSSISSVSTTTTLQPSTRTYDGSGSSQRSRSQEAGPRGYMASYEHTNASAYQDAFTTAQQDQRKNYTNSRDDSFPSPFPKLRDTGPNVPPSDDEKEEILDRARAVVLKSNDPEIQLAWAQDALIWVESAVVSRDRLPAEQSARPSTPRVEHQLRLDAISIINFLADQTHPKAVFIKATWHEFGKFGFPIDKKEAFQLYRISAEKGYARSEYRIGTQYESMHDLGKAIKHYSIGVSMGDSASNYRLGMMTLLGQHGQQQDFVLGIERIRYAAETADENAPQGAYVYGMLLGRELPSITIPDALLPVDIGQAKAFIEKAAYLGFSKAQTKIGQAYELAALGCEFNPGLSLHYNALAARQGEPEAEMAVSKWFLCGFDGLFEKNDELAFSYAQRAAIGGLPTAEFALGYFYEIGICVPMDLGEARKWYQKAADHGNKDAVGRLEGLQLNRTLSRKDHEQIAITRIRSQHGSRRGGRPERFRDQAPTVPNLPAMVEERYNPPVAQVQLPDPRLSSINSAPGLGVQPGGYPPLRPKSTAPYPEDDVAPDPRYSQQAFRPRLQDGPIADRPNSAFGIKPLPAGGAYRQEAGRPLTGAGYRNVPEGRGPNPAGHQRVASAGFDPQPLAPYPHDLPPLPRPMPPPDSGRPYIQDGRNRLQQGGPNVGKQQPSLAPNPLHGPNYAPIRPVQPPAPQARYGNASAPSLQNPAAYDRRSEIPGQGYRPLRIDPGPGRRPESSAESYRPARIDPGPDRRSDASAQSFRSDRVDSAPQNYNRPSNGPNPVSMLSPASPNPPRPTSSASSVAPSIASQSSTTSSKPMKEGPKTFEEMGIPKQKTEGDCVVM